MQITRRQFFKLSATGLGVSSMAALGFSPSEVLAEVRPFRLTVATQTRNICTYCAVGCGCKLAPAIPRSRSMAWR